MFGSMCSRYLPSRDFSFLTIIFIRWLWHSWMDDLAVKWNIVFKYVFKPSFGEIEAWEKMIEERMACRLNSSDLFTFWFVVRVDELFSSLRVSRLEKMCVNIYIHVVILHEELFVIPFWLNKRVYLFFVYIMCHSFYFRMKTWIFYWILKEIKDKFK